MGLIQCYYCLLDWNPEVVAALGCGEHVGVCYGGILADWFGCMRLVGVLHTVQPGYGSALHEAGSNHSDEQSLCDHCGLALVSSQTVGLLEGIHGLFSGMYCGLVSRRVTCGYPWPGLGGNHKDIGMIRERLRSSAWCLSD
ncbi:hypothetical protein Tco_0496096 [Tanacetum coccineum]